MPSTGGSAGGWPASDRRVDVTNVTARYAAMNLAGPRAREVLARLTDLDVSRDGLHVP